jgi:NAD(P)-dependent dehydrogenase (short-subunit alcohol dehydrogenase family)
MQVTYDFRGQVVVITGSTGNLGQATAESFHKAGAALVLLDRDPARQRTIHAELAAQDDHLLLAPIDFFAPDSVKQAVGQIIARFGRIDVLVNTVGGFQAGKFMEMPLEKYEQLMDLNAKTVFLLCQAVIPHMVTQGHGKIINTSARAAMGARSGVAAYAASKAAVVRITESLAAEFIGNGININCVLPGTIDTPENRAAMPNAEQEKWVKPEEVAAVILFLASEAARAVNGVALPVYGES